ncbi:MAG: ABC transporter substrate-binding protein [Oscillospiraceae bacterium]
MKKRIICLLLALVMGLSLAACGGSKTGDEEQKPTGNGTAAGENEGTEVDKSSMSYDELSAYIYEDVLGEFYSTYEAAKETESVSERYALAAIAEAKLLESGVIMPTTTVGGQYALSRVAPYTVGYALWGTDNERYHQALVCTEFITAEDRTEMKAKWNELRGTGTYEAWAKSYLEDKGYTLKSDYTLAYDADPTTWDVFTTYWATDSSAIVNTYDGLYEYDCEGYIQPALATSYEVSEDGCTYTFHLREGVKWVDFQGRELADVQADDFVAGLQHLLDAQAGMEYLAGAYGGCNIVNADAYMAGEVTDFAEVGVKAVDKYTVEYTLAAPCTFFETMLGYTTFAPLCRSYYESMGGKFGVEYDPSAAGYTYGRDPSSIAYCGPYLVTSATDSNSIVFEANESYWNAGNINVKKIVWLYDDGSDVTKLYRDAVSGTLDGVSLNTSTLETAKAEGLFDKYAYVSNTDATTYVTYLNLNRGAFSNVNDDTAAVSPQTEEDAARTNAAVSNVHFRRALTFSVDRAAYNAQQAGEDLKYTSLRNSYTPANFVSLLEDVTVSINGTDVTFPEGTYYGEIMQAQLDADEYPILVWDPEADEGNGGGDGYDGWYNPANAAAELELAIAELAEDGIVVDADNPIYVDFPYDSSNETYSNRANAYKQSVEASLGGKVIVNLVACTDINEWYYCGYYISYGYEANCDIYDLTGWIPDYGDPCNYLDTILPDYAGYQTMLLGIY